MEKIEEILNDDFNVIDYYKAEIKELREDRDYWKKAHHDLLNVIMKAKNSEIRIIQNNK